MLHWKHHLSSKPAARLRGLLAALGVLAVCAAVLSFIFLLSLIHI